MLLIQFLLCLIGRLVENKKLQPSPVKILAEKHQLKVEEISTFKNYELRITNYELNVVCDFGLFIPRDIIVAPKFGSINIHPSLLPKYRGATPIQSALINGEMETGVSIMLMDEKMDHGPILDQKTVLIEIDDTYTKLHLKLANLAQILLPEALLGYLAGEITPKQQIHGEATVL